MSIRFNKRLSETERYGIFNGQRAIFVFVSFQLLLGLLFLLYSNSPGIIELLNITVFPFGLLALGIWSTRNPYPAFIAASIVLGIIAIAQIVFLNLVGLVVLIIVFYYVNRGRQLSYNLQLHRPELDDILDAELED